MIVVPSLLQPRVSFIKIVILFQFDTINRTLFFNFPYNAFVYFSWFYNEEVKESEGSTAAYCLNLPGRRSSLVTSFH